MTWSILESDALTALRGMATSSVDSVVTDPPAGIKFMGAEWDGDKGGRDKWIAWLAEIFAELRRVVKPGAHAVVWALPKTSHWTATALENAGWDVRECCVHLFGSGFPKNHAVSRIAREDGYACGCDDLPDVRKAATATSTEPDSEILRSPLHVGREEEGAHGTSALHGLQGSVDTHHTLPGDQKQDLQPTLSHLPDLNEQIGAQDGPTGTAGGDSMRGLRKTRRSTGQVSEPREDTDMLAPLQRSASLEGDVEARQQGAIWVDSGEPGEFCREDVGPEQSGMEGRRDCLPEEGELQADHVRALSDGVRDDGAQGRIRDDSSAGDGPMGGSCSPADRGRSPRRPRSEQQREGQSGSVAGQPHTQAGGAWQPCRRCGKPRVVEGLGTALKPAAEHWILARAPLAAKTIVDNVLAHGTGAINIDACRIGTSKPACSPSNVSLGGYGLREGRSGQLPTDSGLNPNIGRWPANVTLEHSSSCVLTGTKKVRSGKAVQRNRDGEVHNNVFGAMRKPPAEDMSYADADGLEEVDDWSCSEDCAVRLLDEQAGECPGMTGGGIHTIGYGGGIFGSIDSERTARGDSGGPSRFFYVAKPAKGEKEKGLDWMPSRKVNDGRKAGGSGNNNPRLRGESDRKNFHSTVKPVALMRWLCRLVTPPGGMVLDCFAGSGTTGVAALAEGFSFVGVEQDPEFVGLARARIEGDAPLLNREPKVKEGGSR